MLHARLARGAMHTRAPCARPTCTRCRHTRPLQWMAEFLAAAASLSLLTVIALLAAAAVDG